MEKAKVYFTDFRTRAFGDGLPAKLKKLIRAAGVGQIDMDGKFVAIKLHFGELGNISYLGPITPGRWRTWSRSWGVSLSSPTATRCTPEAGKMLWNTWNAPGKMGLRR